MASNVGEFGSQVAAASSLVVPDLNIDVLGRIFCVFNAEELTQFELVCKLWKQAALSNQVSYSISYPSWIREVQVSKDDIKKYGLDDTGGPSVNRRLFTKALKPLSRGVKNNKGIAVFLRPKNLTLEIVLQIAKDCENKQGFPLDRNFRLLLAVKDSLEDIPSDRTSLLFFTNDFLVDVKSLEVFQNTMKQESGIVVRKPPARDFFAFITCMIANSIEYSCSEEGLGIYDKKIWSPKVPYYGSTISLSETCIIQYGEDRAQEEAVLGGFEFGLDARCMSIPMFDEIINEPRDLPTFGIGVFGDYADITFDTGATVMSQSGADQPREDV